MHLMEIKKRSFVEISRSIRCHNDQYQKGTITFYEVYCQFLLQKNFLIV